MNQVSGDNTGAITDMSRHKRGCSWYMSVWPTLSFAFALVGCMRISGEGEAVAQTKHSLRKWAHAIIVSWDAPIPVWKCSSSQEVIGELMKRGALDDVERSQLENDGWGRRFKWKAEVSDDVVLVYVPSAGKNGGWVAEAASVRSVTMRLTVV